MMRYIDRLFVLPKATVADPESAHVGRLMQVLLKSLLLWLLAVLIVGVPLFAVKKAVSVALGLVALTQVLVCAYFMRLGRVRTAAWVSLIVGWAGVLTCVLLSGGIRSPYMALHVVIPVIGGLLLGRKVAMISLSLTGLVMLIFVVSEYAGHPLPNYFPMPGPISFGALALAVILTYLVVNHIEAYSRQEALRLSEERLQIALQGANAAVFDWDVVEDRFLLSRRFYSALGLEQQAPPASVQLDLEAEMSACKREIVLQAAGGRDHIEHEVRLPAASGHRVWFQVRANVTQRDVQGKASRFVGTLTDVTDQKHAQQELARARDLAREAAQAKTAFLANMSHELRTPVSSIVGLSRLLSEQPIPPDYQEMVKLIASSGEGLLDVINEILDLSRIEAGRIPVRREETDLSSLCHNAVQLLRHGAEQKGIRLDFGSKSTPLGMVAIDPKLVRQILINLLNNAIKFTERGAVRLDLEWIPGVAPEGTVKLSVTDTGPGIPRDQQGLVFEPFTQVDSTARRSHQGTGLGLAISRKLVHALGGKIGLESTPGSGSTFWFTVPVELAEARRGDPPELRGPASYYAKLRVLVAEDNKVNRLVAVRCLLTLGIRADTAENGEQAIAAASSTPYDLILMDVQMPGIDGLQATRAIRVCSRGNPFIVALTAHILPEHRAECLGVGMNDFLSKPLEVDALREILTRNFSARAKAHAV